MPDPMKTGLLPLISDKGANSIGEQAKPTAHVVTPVLNARFERPHFWLSGSAAIEYDPALKAANSVTAQDMKSMMSLRVLLQ